MELFIKFNPVALSLAIPALISGSLAFYAFARRPVVGSRVFAFLMLALCVWSVFYGLELSCVTIDGMLACAAVEYLGIASVPVLWLILTLLYTGREKWVTRRNVILLFVVPSITVVMVATNQLHHFYYDTASVDTGGPFPMLALTRGPWFWVHSIYSYAALLAGTVLLIERLWKPGTIFRNQVIAMLIGVSVPWVVSILYVAFGFMLFRHVDPTPFAFTITGLVVAWSMFRLGLFDIVPLAYDTVVDSINDAIVVMDRQDRIVEYNKAARDILGLSPALIGQSADVVWKDWPKLMNLRETDGSASIEIVSGRLDSTRCYEASSYNVANWHKQITGKVILLHDITDRKLADEALRESEAKHQLLIENSHDIIYTINIQGIMTFVSPAWKRLLGHDTDAVVGHPFQEFMHPDDIARCEKFLASVLETMQASSIEYRVKHLTGDWRWHNTNALPVLNAHGTCTSFVGIASDVTERKQLQQKLEEMANHDFLTGLPNRVLLLDRFTVAAALAQRNKARLAVMSLDLDKFKTINDTHGHEAGDQVLKAVSTRITGIIRASDTLARIGGDEFILVMLETNHREDSTAIARKILDSFREPLLIDSHQLQISTSIGIALYPEDAEDMETLIKKSDAALYYAKGHGRNQFRLYSDGDLGYSADRDSAA